jgi:hypothetical protein
MLADVHLRHIATQRNLTDEEKARATTLQDTFERDYQKWYTESLAVIRQLIPDRQSEFEHLYKGDGKRRDMSKGEYYIQDWLNGIRAPSNSIGKKIFDDFAGAVMRFSTQLNILKAAEGRFESALFDIKQLVQADLLDSEIEAARELASRGFLRAAGAVAGVVLEKHLAQVAANHSVTLRKQHPTISDLNDALKGGGVLDVPAWRSIQRLGDLRNLCDHNKHRDPTNDEIVELADGVEKLTKTLF